MLPKLLRERQGCGSIQKDLWERTVLSILRQTYAKIKIDDYWNLKQMFEPGNHRWEESGDIFLRRLMKIRRYKRKIAIYCRHWSMGSPRQVSCEKNLGKFKKEWDCSILFGVYINFHERINGTERKTGLCIWAWETGLQPILGTI